MPDARNLFQNSVSHNSSNPGNFDDQEVSDEGPPINQISPPRIVHMRSNLPQGSHRSSSIRESLDSESELLWGSSHQSMENSNRHSDDNSNSRYDSAQSLSIEGSRRQSSRRSGLHRNDQSDNSYSEQNESHQSSQRLSGELSGYQEIELDYGHPLSMNEEPGEINMNRNVALPMRRMLNPQQHMMNLQMPNLQQPFNPFVNEPQNLFGQGDENSREIQDDDDISEFGSNSSRGGMLAVVECHKEPYGHFAAQTKNEQRITDCRG